MLLVIFCFILTIYIELPELLRKGYFREAIVCFCFIIMGYWLFTLFVLRIPIVSPVKISVYIIKDLLHINYK